MRIALGQRLNGWVAANRQSIVNSDPSLDFGDVASTRAFSLRSCLSTPLLADGQLVGVLALYSAQLGAFTDEHRRLVEVVARHVSHAVHRAAKVNTQLKRAVDAGCHRQSDLDRSAVH